MECYIVYRNNYLCICGRNIKYAKMYHVYLYIYTITEVLFFFTYIFMKNHLVHRIHSFIQCVLCTCLNLKYYLYCVVYLVVCLYIYISIDIHISMYTKYAEYILIYLLVSLSKKVCSLNY